MKKAKDNPQHRTHDADILPEYDFSGGIRGKHYKAMRQGYSRVVHHPDGTQEITHFRPLAGSVLLDPDVRAYFPDAEAVNTALRGLIALLPKRRRAARKEQKGTSWTSEASSS